VRGDERLDSWKEIAGYLRRAVRTAQRWERTAGLPVRRVASRRSAVYAFRSELDSWWQRQSARLGDDGHPTVPAEPSNASTGESDRPPPSGRVRSFLSHAIDIDPESAQEHAKLAVYFFTLVPMGLTASGEGMPAARAAARRAQDLDPANADALAMAATVTGVYDYDWKQAGRMFDRAYATQPVPPITRFHYAVWYLSPLQRHGDCLCQLARGLADDPLYLLGRVHVAMEYLSLNRFAEGIAELEHVLRIDPQFGPALGHLGRELAIRGRVEEALSLARRTNQSIPRHPNAIGYLAGMLRRTGDSRRAEELLGAVDRERPWCAARARAESHIVCGEWQEALHCLGAAIVNRDPGVWITLAGTAGQMIRALPGWPATRCRLRLPDPA
jgi:hypothetical protein